ncbi:DASS family sodium-coupled anion symporter [Streptococcus orisasini]
MKNRWIKLAIIVAIMVGIWFIPTPEGLKTETWHLVSVYIGLLLGLVIKPFSEPVITLIIIAFVSMFIEPDILLNGYGDAMTWFILLVTVVCTAFIKTGLGRRLAYNLLIRGGNSTLQLGYTLLLTDVVLSPATGSNSSRTSIIYPVFRSIAEGADSMPDNHPRRLGAFLTILTYISSQGTSALFLTGMATNAITVSLISKMLKIDISWGMWAMASIVPVGLFLGLAPFIVSKVYPPELTSLEDVKVEAKKQLAEMGAMTSPEKRLLVIFILAILGWVFGANITVVNLSMQMVGFLFLALVMLAGILDWNDVIEAKGAWHIFVWYGAFYGVASALADAGFYTWLADRIGKVLDLSQVNGLLVTLILVLLSLAVRYFFVSNSAFVASFYPVLFSMAVNTQANLTVVGLLLAFFSPIGALLTHYGNGAGLITFASGYVSQKDFWRIGTIMVVVALIIFFVIGLPYWKIIGIW